MDDFKPSPIANLMDCPPEVVRQCVDECDLPSILGLRHTSRLLHSHATAVLARDRRHLLLPFISDPSTLWDYLNETKAVVGGLAALSFILRDKNILPTTLDIFVSSLDGGRLEQLLQEQLDLPVYDVQRLADPFSELEPRVYRSVTYAARMGRFIAVHTSLSCSALDPIAVSPTTALINWVSSGAFACGYPALTLRRRSLGISPFGPQPLLHSIQRRLLDFNFDIRSEPSAWPEYAAAQPENPGRQPCLREAYVCPCQGRFFGDSGSLLAVFDLLGADVRDLARSRLPPYGFAVAWRLSSSHRPCHGPCERNDPLLPQGMFSIMITIVDTGFSFRSLMRP